MEILFCGIPRYLPRNKIFLKNDNYFPGNGIFSFSEIWKEYHANSSILA